MLDKIKTAWGNIKDFSIYVLGPIIGLLAYIYYLTTKNKELETKITQTESEKALADTLAKKEEADNEQKAATDAYTALRDKYLKQSSDS